MLMNRTYQKNVPFGEAAGGQRDIGHLCLANLIKGTFMPEIGTLSSWQKSGQLTFLFLKYKV